MGDTSPSYGTNSNSYLFDASDNIYPITTIRNLQYLYLNSVGEITSVTGPTGGCDSLPRLTYVRKTTGGQTSAPDSIVIFNTDSFAPGTFTGLENAGVTGAPSGLYWNTQMNIVSLGPTSNIASRLRVFDETEATSVISNTNFLTIGATMTQNMFELSGNITFTAPSEIRVYHSIRNLTSGSATQTFYNDYFGYDSSSDVLSFQLYAPISGTGIADITLYNARVYMT